MGNLRSILNKFNKIGVKCIITSRIDDLKKADKLILPGVGHFKAGMRNLAKLELIDTLNELVLIRQVPILGICLGAQLFANYSEEGNCEGLNWIDVDVKKINVSDNVKYKVPHMGWNSVEIFNKNELLTDISPADQFYFVHSYFIECKDEKDIWMKTNYDFDFVSAVKKNNIYGTQFHPEKSHDIGYKLLKNFSEL